MKIHRLFSVWYYRPTDMLSATCMCVRLLPICKTYLLVYWVLSIGKSELTQYSMYTIIKLLVGIILLHTPPPHCLVWSIISYSIRNCEGFSCKTKLDWCKDHSKHQKDDWYDSMHPQCLTSYVFGHTCDMRSLLEIPWLVFTNRHSEMLVIM